MRSLFRVAPAAMLLAIAPQAVRAQQAAMPAPGSYVGFDSLDASHEPATPSRHRAAVTGSATWAVEIDSLDLRRKFTIRIEVAGPARMTIVLRTVDSLVPQPGRYLTMIPSTGASHSRVHSIHADVYAMEAGGSRAYFSMDTLDITRVATSGGQPIVEGRLTMLADRYADAPEGTQVRKYVWLRESGELSARAARDTRPPLAVTAKMQEAVLRRALEGFAITSIGAINGDGDADSTHDVRRARAFLESRWRESAIVERLELNPPDFDVALRGRFVPVVCDISYHERFDQCSILPVTIAQAGSARSGAIGGRFLRESMSPAARRVTTVHLLPNPVPLRTAYEKMCASQDSIEAAAERELMPKLKAMTDSAKVDSALTAFIRTGVTAQQASDRRLFESFAVRHAPIAADGRFSFADVPVGNYLLFAWSASDDERAEWFVPVTMNGSAISQDLGKENVNATGWACGMPLPFATVRKKGR